VSRRHRLIALLTGVSPAAVRPIIREPYPDPYAGTLTASDLPQRLREAAAL
jgi:hypothetical protein